MVGVLGLRGCLHEKTRTGTSFILQWLFDFVSRLLNDQLISYLAIWRYTLHGEKIHVLFKVANITHAATRCSLPADRFHTKCVVVSHWNDTVVMFRTGVNFSPRYIKQGELTPEAPHMRGSWTNADELTFTCPYLSALIQSTIMLKSLKKIKNWMVNSPVPWYVN